MPVKPNRHSPTRARGASRAHNDRGSSPNLLYPTEPEAEPDLTAFEDALSLEGEFTQFIKS